MKPIQLTSALGCALLGLMLASCRVERQASVTKAPSEHTSIQTDCVQCHERNRFKVTNGVVHGDGRSCKECHEPGISWARTKMFDHASATPESCRKCHEPRRPSAPPAFFKEISGHFPLRDCVDCHRNPSVNMEAETKPWKFFHPWNQTPAVSFTGPIELTSGGLGLTVEGTCIKGLTATLAGTGLSTKQLIKCDTGTFSIPATFSPGDGVKTITLTQTNGQGKVFSAERKFVRDSDGPNALALRLSSGDLYTSSAIVTLAVSGSSDAEDMYITNSPGCGTGGSWEGFRELKAGWLLPQLNASNTIYFKLRDERGNESECSSTTIIHDNQAPVVAISAPASGLKAKIGVTLEGSCESGLTVNVSGTGIASDATASCNDGAFSVPVTFSANDGTKNILVSQTDGAGNRGSANRNFVRDNSAPSSPSILLGGGARALPYGQNVTFLQVSASSATEMYITSVPGCAVGGWWRPYQPTVDTWPFNYENGKASVYAKFRNEVLNESDCVSDTITICNQDYLFVPPDSSQGTMGFCVSKYEMKAVDLNGNLANGGNGQVAFDLSSLRPAARPDGTPWVNLNRDQAISACASLGANYHLITNAEWQSVARNIEKVSENVIHVTEEWRFYRGHSDGSAGSIAGGFTLAAYPWYEIPRIVDSGPEWTYRGTGNTTGSEQRRALLVQAGSYVQVVNGTPQTKIAGSYIWDFAGNAWEFVSDNMNASTYGFTEPYRFVKELADNSIARRDFGPAAPKSTYYLSQNLGMIFTTQSGGAVTRGGYYGAMYSGYNFVSSGSGIFSADFSVTPTTVSPTIGFRCVYIP